jgi:cytidylate kinase
MSIICISGQPYTSSDAIARQVAARLGYEYVDQEVFAVAADRSGIPLPKLHKAFEEPPSLFGMSSATRKRCIAHVQAAVSSRLLQDNVVYLGSFGHLLIQGVSHVLKVRIAADLDDRIARLTEQEGCSTQEARKQLLRADNQHKALGKLISGMEDEDAKLFDLVISISQTTGEAATETITETVKQKRYQAMTYSLRVMRNLELSHRLKALLSDLDPDADVKTEDGRVQIRSRSSGRGKSKRLDEIRKRAEELDEVHEVTVIPVEDTIDRFADKLR